MRRSGAAARVSRLPPERERGAAQGDTRCSRLTIHHTSPTHTESGEHVQQERFRRGARARLRKIGCAVRGARTHSSRRLGFLYALVAAHISPFYRAQVGEVA
jgi:hypothetical protein